MDITDKCQLSAEEQIQSVRSVLDEIEILLSIFLLPDELVFSDSFILDDMRSFLQEASPSPHPFSVSFIVRLTCPDLFHERLEVHVSLPLRYPLYEAPNLTIRCSTLCRADHDIINMSMADHLHLFQGECCVFQGMEWLRENFRRLVPLHCFLPVSPSPVLAFKRDIIYFHHIYNKQKRKNILSWASELNLTGLSCPGKPGLIIIEGI